MRNRRILAIFFCLVMSLCTNALALPGGEFFPLRPAHARLASAEGTLFDYGMGNRAGGVNLRDRSGIVHRYFISGDLRVDGKPVACAWPPEPGFYPGKAACATWPAYLVLRVTLVRVTSFDAVRFGEHVRVIDRIEVIDPAPYHGTLPKR